MNNTYKKDTELWEKIYDVLDESNVRYDTNYCESETEAIIEFWTDTAGQDIVTEFDYDGTPEDFIEQFTERAENYDVDEEVELYVNMRGKDGVPDTVRELLDDCEEAKDTLMEISRKLKNVLTENNEHDESYKHLGIAGSVKELISILKGLPKESSLSAAGGDCHVIIQVDSDGICKNVIFDEKDYSEEWNDCD